MSCIRMRSFEGNLYHYIIIVYTLMFYMLADNYADQERLCLHALQLILQLSGFCPCSMIEVMCY